ncbi:unnamed protein product [Ilex paraguariensis]|uniref:Nuclear cap-binding protein subunit 2 n=1 Tax=Ilex paraguariensis TaxID=185542 RepID=A0ABC8SZR2_9AQUA
MASLFKDPNKLSAYRDRRFPGTQEEFEQALMDSTTLYIGNMSFYTTEEQVYELFSRAGEIKKIVMGLDKNTKTPCGFCFVIIAPMVIKQVMLKVLSATPPLLLSSSKGSKLGDHSCLMPHLDGKVDLGIGVEANILLDGSDSVTRLVD